MKAELLSTDTGIVLCADVWKRVYFPVSKAEGRQTVVIVEKVLFLFVEFEIIVGTADWMDAENTGIQTDGYGFPGKVEPDSRPTFFGIQFSFHCIPVFSYPLQFHVPDKFKIQQIKTKTELFQLRLTVYPVSAFEAGKYTCFQTAAQNTVLCQPIKFCLRFFLFEFEIVGGKRSR